MAGIDHAALAARAAQQLGLVTTRELEEMRVSRRQRQNLVTSGILRRASTGVWAVASVPSSAHQRLLAATLAAGPGAAVSHLAAAWVWGFDGIRPRAIELSVPKERNPRVPAAKLHRLGDLLAVDVSQRGP